MQKKIIVYKYVMRIENRFYLIKVNFGRIAQVQRFFVVMLLLFFLAPAVFSGEPPASLIENGDFEEGYFSPSGWIVPQDPEVKFIMADSYHKRVLELNSLDPPTTATILYQTPLIQIENGRDFLFKADIKTLGTALTITVIGFGEVQGESRIVYRTITKFNADSGGWRRIKRRFCPSCRNYKVSALRIIFSCSETPGKVFIDNISLVPFSPVPAQSREKITKINPSETDSPLV